ncbi:MAG: hypothetical protein KJP02_05140 [Octadecabacter sp.]|nr:hypothetical protein [Octadecabacter sp.]
MDFFDFFQSNGTEGTKRMRILTGSIGALLGAVIGVALFHVLQAEPASAVTNGIFGALIGGALGALFSFYVLIGLLFVVFFVAVFLWQYFVTGIP